MLFILAMDPLQQLVDKATQAGLLTPIGADPVKMRTSLYVDDAVMFLRPIVADVENLQALLHTLVWPPYFAPMPINLKYTQFDATTSMSPTSLAISK
jgi:hypothetical protein